MSSTAADTVIQLYQEHAASWVASRGTGHIERPWLDAFLDAMPPKGLNRRDVLDIGCGSGTPVGGYLIEKGCNITGVDGAPALIDVAKQSFPNQVWITADMRDLPPMGKFHGLVAWHSFIHLTPADQRHMFATFCHLSHPGAALLFTSGTTHGEAIGTFQDQPLYHASLDAAEYRALLRANNFEVIRHVENDPTCGGATLWLAKKSLNVD